MTLAFCKITLVAVECRSEIADVNRYLRDDERVFSWTFCCEDKNRKDAIEEWWWQFVTHFADCIKSQSSKTLRENLNYQKISMMRVRNPQMQCSLRAERSDRLTSHLHLRVYTSGPLQLPVLTNVRLNKLIPVEYLIVIIHVWSIILLVLGMMLP